MYASSDFSSSPRAHFLPGDARDGAFHFTSHRNRSNLPPRLHDLLTRANRNLGEAYVLGDSPLVLLTALQSAWEIDPASSKYTTLPTPKINAQGAYEPNPTGRPLRVYTQLDTRLMFEDFYAKVALFGERQKSQ